MTSVSFQYISFANFYFSINQACLYITEPSFLQIEKNYIKLVSISAQNQANSTLENATAKMNENEKVTSETIHDMKTVIS